MEYGGIWYVFNVVKELRRRRRRRSNISSVSRNCSVSCVTMVTAHLSRAHRAHLNMAAAGRYLGYASDPFQTAHLCTELCVQRQLCWHTIVRALAHSHSLTPEHTLSVFCFVFLTHLGVMSDGPLGWVFSLQDFLIHRYPKKSSAHRNVELWSSHALLRFFSLSVRLVLFWLRTCRGLCRTFRLELLSVLSGATCWPRVQRHLPVKACAVNTGCTKEPQRLAYATPNCELKLSSTTFANEWVQYVCLVLIWSASPVYRLFIVYLLPCGYSLSDLYIYK